MMQTKSEILKLIKSISSRGKKIDADIQVAGIASIYYSVCHGDVTIGQKLLEHFPAGSRKAAIVAFLEQFGQFEYKGKTVIYRKNEKVSSLLENPEEAEKYCADIKVHWTALKPETVKSQFNCEDAVKNLISRMEREIKAGNSTKSEVFDVISAAWNTYVESRDTDEDEQEEPETLASQANLGKVVNM